MRNSIKSVSECLFCKEGEEGVRIMGGRFLKYLGNFNLSVKKTCCWFLPYLLLTCFWKVRLFAVVHVAVVVSTSPPPRMPRVWTGTFQVDMQTA